LFEIAKAHKCNKIALGHHQDDILETLLMNLTHQGAFGTMPPRLRMDKFDMEIIRPMCLVEERVDSGRRMERVPETIEELSL
jgi:tRNA 2-thiocytidine biosynthesis protein TtcA